MRSEFVRLFTQNIGTVLETCPDGTIRLQRVWKDGKALSQQSNSTVPETCPDGTKRHRIWRRVEMKPSATSSGEEVLFNENSWFVVAGNCIRTYNKMGFVESSH